MITQYELILFGDALTEGEIESLFQSSQP